MYDICLVVRSCSFFFFFPSLFVHHLIHESLIYGIIATKGACIIADRRGVVGQSRALKTKCDQDDSRIGVTVPYLSWL